MTYGLDKKHEVSVMSSPGPGHTTGITDPGATGACVLPVSWTSVKCILSRKTNLHNSVSDHQVDGESREPLVTAVMKEASRGARPSPVSSPEPW